MKARLLLIVLTITFFTTSKALSQDAIFTQWDNMPIYLNPALTGNFVGQIRVRAQYRDQWRSILKKASYKTSAISTDYKFSNSSARKISVGAFILRERAGTLDFRDNGFHITSSIIQPLGNPDRAHHAMAIGFDFGWASRSLKGDAQWPGGGWPPPPPTYIEEKTSYPDVSAGLLWDYKSNTHFSYQLGTALHHINKPNVSFSDTSVSRLYNRFNLHGKLEIPLFAGFSIGPSFLYYSQGPAEQLAFGLNNRWYFKALNPNFAQLGIFAKTTQKYDGTTNIDIYVLSATAEINSFQFGFSFDQFDGIDSNTYEFSLGYTFGLPGSKDQ